MKRKILCLLLCSGLFLTACRAGTTAETEEAYSQEEEGIGDSEDTEIAANGYESEDEVDSGTAETIVGETSVEDIPDISNTQSSAKENGKRIAIGDSHAAAIRSDGTVSLSTSSTTSSYVKGTFRDVEDWTDIVEVAVEDQATYGLKADGTVLIAGGTDYSNGNDFRYKADDWTDVISITADSSLLIGIRADGTLLTSAFTHYSFFDVSDWTDITDVATGEHFIFGLHSDGTVVVDKSSKYGDKVYDTEALEEIETWTDIVGVASGSDFLAALCSDGTVRIVVPIMEDYAGGLEETEITEILKAQEWTDIVDIAAGSKWLIGLKSDGTVTIAGDYFYKEEVETWTGILAVDATSNNVMGLRYDETVLISGNTSAKELSLDLPEEEASLEAIEVNAEMIAEAAIDEESGMQHYATRIADAECGLFAVTSDGRVLHDEGRDFMLEVDEWTDIVAVAGGRDHVVGLKSDGTVVVAEDVDSSIYQDYGQGDTQDWTDIVMIAAGASTTIGLKSDGTVVATGCNDDGQCDVEDWTGIIMISAGNAFTVGLRADGTVVAAGDNSDGGINVDHWENVAAISSGCYKTYGIDMDGNKVGDSSRADDSPRVVAISAHAATNYVILYEDGTVSYAGDSGYDRIDIRDWTDIVQISRGSAVTALTADGNVIRCRDNETTTIWTSDELGW